MDSNTNDLLDDLTFCVRFLTRERYGDESASALLARLGTDEQALFNTYRDLVNVREPLPASPDFLVAQDRMLRRMIAQTGITNAEDLPRTPRDQRISLWRGDITRLQADAIVNAANSQMLGCWVPGHHCIDNAIHTFAGIQLRAHCARLMSEQGYPEPTGMAKVTPAFNLPARLVVHTVGPIASGHPTDVDRALLKNSYASCLDAAFNAGATNLAFCCISTGVFGFPQEEAASLAVAAVQEWLDAHEAPSAPKTAAASSAPASTAPASAPFHVIFNVFTEKDEALYHELLCS